ncbi:MULTISPECIES: FadR/GntR family transcriptional regulator [Polaromonas]|uniref:FadR/GntR family transcriptional regulator n=1 Tax=Polaromonas aquatica TaxID=332657 RepID=A0ABW1U2Q0_9BURK
MSKTLGSEISELSAPETAQPRSAPQMFKKLASAPAYQLVFDAIETQIVSGALVVGDQLPSETELARQFGVNRSTVREGIRLLEHSGFVAREGSKRLLVTLPHYMHLASRASRALVMHQVTFRELWDASMVTEPAAAHRAATRISAEQLADLEANTVAMRQHIEDPVSVVELDVEFHDLIAEASGNRVLMLTREPIGLLFKPAGQIILPRLHTQQRILDAHCAILDLLKRGDADGVAVWMTRHMADFKRGYEKTGVDMDTPLDMAMVAAR